MPISAIANGVASLANYASQNATNEANRRNQQELLRETQRFQREENLNMYTTLRRSLERAGLNVNSQFGGYPTTSSPSGSLAQMQAPQIDLSGSAALLQQAPLVMAQAEKTKAEADAQIIENQRKRTEDITYENDTALDAYNDAKKDNPDLELPDLKVVPHNRGWFEAKRNLNLLKGEQQTTEIQGFENSLRKLVVNKQMANPAVVEAFVTMPIAQKKQLVELANQAVAEAALAGQKEKESVAQEKYISAQEAYTLLMKKVQEDNNLVGYVDKIFNGDFSWKDAAKILVLAAVMRFGK